MKILLIEDSKHLRTYIKIALEREHYAVDVAKDGMEGLWYVESFDYDVILLDIMLPHLDGLNLLQKRRAAGDQTHILLLTAKDKIADRVKGLQMGADDYLVKPFDISELLARIQALTRRSYDQKNPKIHLGELSIDTITKKICIGDQTINLTSREYLILEYLAMRQGEVVSRADIEEHIYDTSADIMSNVVNSTICIIRKKLAPYQHRDFIKTHRGLGYSIKV